MTLLLPDLVRRIIGVLYHIHEEGGPSLADEDYIEAMRQELGFRNLNFLQNENVVLEYLGKTVGEHVVEFIVEKKILVDLKGQFLLKHPTFYKQMLSYLVKENLPMALIVNFHSRRLELRRVLNPNYNYQLQ
ncbi:MAG: hypothetical protein UT63_C0095G0003 [Candidatus Gottesmanbacteria bacterium GW2011_GWC2_39_8]|uniref:GxxExxY protein n=1 Tax=Candidatus Gottesmanbacteria bacterium GW2011_GWC2_39_8 TaxID=1618450 RepID=A0A0G0SYJ4_9BACT|nr:MAG: hypothetical protein UT63_C0095G0003 [Candidatus Gottesmanbacteria bacterium GW2011_GWC2_39_8]